MQSLAFSVLLSSLTLLILQIVIHEINLSSNQKHQRTYNIPLPYSSPEQLKAFLLAQVEEGNAVIMRSCNIELVKLQIPQTKKQTKRTKLFLK